MQTMWCEPPSIEVRILENQKRNKTQGNLFYLLPTKYGYKVRSDT